MNRLSANSFTCVLIGLLSLLATAQNPSGKQWIGTWATAPQPPEPGHVAVRVNARTMRPEGTPERITNGNGLIAGVSASADGRRLAILRRTLQPNVYVAQLQDHGTRLSTPQLLTPDEWYDFPTAWTSDSKSVLFFSDRDGVFHIFKQAIDQTQPQLLVGGGEAVALPRLNPDGSIVLYVNSRYDVARIRPPLGTQQLMRVPVTGGPPQLVLEGRGINNLQCARLPSTLCIYSELAPGEEHFYTFDPLKGKGNEIPGATIHESDFYSFNWSLSPDGKLLAFSKKFGTQGQPAIRLFSLVDAKERRISLPGWAGIATLDWSADGESLWSTAFTTSETTSGLWTTGFNATGEWTLLKVELTGKVTPMLRESKMNLGWAIPSPDGSKLAIWKANAPRMCGWQRVSEQLAENLGPNSSLLITSPHRLQSPQLGLWRSTGRLSGCMVGNSYLGITSELPVIRSERMLCKPDYNLDRVSGLHPSVHKPHMSVWTGSVFE